MDDVPRQTLCELIDDYGESLCEDGRRCEALLRDHCPEFRRQIFVLISALNEGIPSGLLQSQGGMPIEATIKQLRTRLSERLGLTDDLSLWAVETWALALGLAAPEEVDVIHFVCPKCGMDCDIPSRLAGKDVTCRRCRSAVRISRDGTQFILKARRITDAADARTPAVPGWSIPSEDLLREALRVAMADGKIVAMENVMLERLRRRLGLPAETANRIWQDVMREGGAAGTEVCSPLFLDWPKMRLRRPKVNLPQIQAENGAILGALIGSAFGVLPGAVIGGFFGPKDSALLAAVGTGALALVFAAVFLGATRVGVNDWRGGCGLALATFLGCCTGWAIVASGGGLIVGAIGGALLGALLGAGAGAFAIIVAS